MTYEFKYADAIASRIPIKAPPAISTLTGSGSVIQDEIVPLPKPIQALAGRTLSARKVDEQRIELESSGSTAANDLPAIAAATPNAYLLNNAMTKASALLAGGITGQDGVRGVRRG